VDVINRVAVEVNRDRRHRIRFVRDGEIASMSLAELDAGARRIAARLRARGLRPGDRVGVMAGNCMEWVVLDLAVLKAGGVTCGLDAGRFDPSTAIERYGLRMLFVDGGEVATWLSDGGAPEAPLHAGYAPDAPIALKFTSGSTGSAKAMEALVAGVNDSLTAVQEMFAHGDGDDLLVFLRLSLLQQRYWIYSALAFGHDVTITSLEQALPASRAARPTVIMGVPGFYQELSRRLGPIENVGERRRAIQGALGGRVRHLWTGSAPASLATLDYFCDAGVPLYQGYGLNETCIVSKNHPGADRRGSVGRLLPHMSARLDERGVLVVKARHPIVRGYAYCAPGDAEKMFLPSGEVVTQDLARVDEDGYLYILGRVDDVVVLNSGRNVNVAQIEARLREYPAVAEIVLFGHGRPFLVAVVSPAAGANAAAIEAHVRASSAELFPEQQVRGVVVADEPFTVESGQLTPQWKPVRREIFRRHAGAIAALYRRC